MTPPASDEASQTTSETTAETLAARVTGDPDLSLAERETALRFADDQDRARVYSASPGVVRRLLAHDDVRVSAVTLHDGEGIQTVEPDEAVGVDVDVVSLRGTLPVGAIGVKSVPRKTNQSAAVVSEGVFGE